MNVEQNAATPASSANDTIRSKNKLHCTSVDVATGNDANSAAAFETIAASSAKSTIDRMRIKTMKRARKLKMRNCTSKRNRLLFFCDECLPRFGFSTNSVSNLSSFSKYVRTSSKTTIVCSSLVALRGTRDTGAKFDELIFLQIIIVNEHFDY